MITLRDYQADHRGEEGIREAYRQRHRTVLYVLPTGGGKTVLASSMVAKASARGRRILFMAHRRELIEQASETFGQFGIEHGVIMSGRSGNRVPVQLGMVGMIANRTERIAPPDFIVVDEAHHSSAQSYRKILAAFPRAHVLGITATPARTDGAGLGDIYQAIVVGPQMRELIEMGALAPFRVFGPERSLDLSGVKTSRGEYDARQLADVMDRSTITGDAVEHYKRLCPTGRAVAFCVSIEHAAHVAETFRAAGIEAASIDGRMHKGTRAELLDDLASGRLKILTSCELISEGYDLPTLDAAILLRPTQSLILHLQQCGRALRMSPGKMEAVILDHANNTFRHGFPDEPREWSLEGRRKGAKTKLNQAPVSVCRECFAYYPAALRKCPHCDAVRIGTARTIECRDGQLVEITPSDEWRAEVRARGAHVCRLGEEEVEITKETNGGRNGIRIRRQGGSTFRPFLAMDMAELKSVGQALGYKPGWAQRMYWINKHGRPPQGGEIWRVRREYAEAGR